MSSASFEEIKLILIRENKFDSVEIAEYSVFCNWSYQKNKALEKDGFESFVGRGSGPPAILTVGSEGVQFPCAPPLF